MKLIRLYSILALTLILAGCGTLRLTPDGAYGRIDAARPAVTSGLTLGQQLVKIDQDIAGARSLIEAFLTWEKANRAGLKPEIVKFAAQLRVSGKASLQSAVKLRDAFEGDPNANNRNAIDTALNVIDALLLEVAKYRTGK
jgi:hypothetical protein